MSKIEELISEIEDYIDSCKAQPFSNNKKIIVDKDIIDDLLVDLRLRVPDEIKKYQKIISSRDSILSDAKAKADSLLNAANKQTDELINEHEIMQQAYAQANEVVEMASRQAQEILDNATIEANEVKAAAMQYTDDILGNLETIIAHSIESTRQQFDRCVESLQGCLDIVKSNRMELNPSGGQAVDEEPDLKEEESITLI